MGYGMVLAGGWIKRGERGYLKSNTGRQRLNINGALNVADLKATVRFEDTINAETTIDLLRDVEHQYPKASVITSSAIMRLTIKQRE